MKRVSLLILLTVCACAHPDNIWVNPNLAQHDFKQERFQCLQIPESGAFHVQNVAQQAD